MSASTRSERLNLLVTAEEKAALEAKAVRAGLSLSELLRRGAAAYEPSSDTGDWRGLLHSVSDMADRLIPEIDASLAKREARTRACGDPAAIKASVAREFAENDWGWVPPSEAKADPC